jgi:hypothetical protein
MRTGWKISNQSGHMVEGARKGDGWEYFIWKRRSPPDIPAFGLQR